MQSKKVETRPRAETSIHIVIGDEPKSGKLTVRKLLRRCVTYETKRPRGLAELAWGLVLYNWTCVSEEGFIHIRGKAAYCWDLGEAVILFLSMGLGEQSSFSLFSCNKRKKTSVSLIWNNGRMERRVLPKRLWDQYAGYDKEHRQDKMEQDTKAQTDVSGGRLWQIVQQMADDIDTTDWWKIKWI